MESAALGPKSMNTFAVVTSVDWYNLDIPGFECNASKESRSCPFVWAEVRLGHGGVDRAGCLSATTCTHWSHSDLTQCLRLAMCAASTSGPATTKSFSVLRA